MRLLHAAIQPPGAKLAHRFPDIFAARDADGQRQDLLPGGIRRQEGKGKVVPPNRGAVVRPQFILEGKGLDAIPSFYSVIRFLIRLRTVL